MIPEDLQSLLDVAGSLEVSAPQSTADPRTLASGQLSGWIAEVEATFGRLLLSGLAYPDGDTPHSFRLLAERAGELGCSSALRRLTALAELTSSQQPGPNDPGLRTQISQRTWTELLATQRWLDAFKREVALATAVVVSTGTRVEQVQVEVPRFSGTVWVDGVALQGHTLVVHGHSDAGDPVLIADPLVNVDAAAPFERPVLSRLFQAEMHLRDWGDHSIVFERHPMTRKGKRCVLRPDVRSIPRHVPGVARRPSAPSVEVELRATVRLGVVELATADGRPVGMEEPLPLNVLKRLVVAGETSSRFRGTGLMGRQALHLIAVRGADRLQFPSTDPACWAIEASLLQAWCGQGSAWLVLAVSLFTCDRPLVDRTSDWRLAWCAVRGDHPVEAVPTGNRPTDVWLAALEGAPLQPFFTDRAPLDPTLDEAAAHALLLDGLRGRPDALDYLQAHLKHLRTTVDKGHPLPPSEHLLYAADVLAWLTEQDRTGPIGDALGLPASPLRYRLVQQLLHWRLTGEEGEVADTLALAAVSSWGAAVVARQLLS